MTSLLCTFLGFLAEAILFFLLRRLCLGLYELVCWGASLVRKGPHRTSQGERVANWRLGRRLERAYLSHCKRAIKKSTTEIVGPFRIFWRSHPRRRPQGQSAIGEGQQLMATFAPSVE